MVASAITFKVGDQVLEVACNLVPILKTGTALANRCDTAVATYAHTAFQLRPLISRQHLRGGPLLFSESAPLVYKAILILLTSVPGPSKGEYFCSQ